MIIGACLFLSELLMFCADVSRQAVCAGNFACYRLVVVGIALKQNA